MCSPSRATRRRRHDAAAFALVELLIVVIILAIMAAMAVPQFTSSPAEARRNALDGAVQTVRSQIEAYRSQHGGALPDLANSWTPLTGATAHRGRGCGPYLGDVPGNAVRGGASTVKNGTAIVAGETYGFVYDYGTAGNGSGRFWGVDEDADGNPSLIGD